MLHCPQYGTVIAVIPVGFCIWYTKYQHICYAKDASWTLSCPPDTFSASHKKRRGLQMDEATGSMRKCALSISDRTCEIRQESARSRARCLVEVAAISARSPLVFLPIADVFLLEPSSSPVS